MMFAAAQFLWGQHCVLPVTLIRQNSHCKPIWNARVSICGSILYKITSWLWMRAEFIIHMETNKENNVSLTEWHVCSPATAPAAALLPVSRQPAVFSSHMSPPPTHSASQPFPLLPLPSHPEQKAWNTRRTSSPQAPHCVCGSKTESLGVSLLLTCARLYAGQTNAHPPPHYMFKNSPQSLPTPCLLPKHFPAAAIWIWGPLRRKEGIWHTPWRLRKSKKKELNCSLHGNVLKQD